MEIEAGLLELYRDPSLAEKPKLLEERGGAFYSEAAAALVASLPVIVLLGLLAVVRRRPYVPRRAELPADVERTVKGRDGHRRRAPPGGAVTAGGGGARDLGPPDLPGPGQDVRRHVR